MSTPYVEANGLHSAPSIMAVEYETADFLYGLVRLLKPRIIIETGTGEGHSTQAMARAAKDNGFGFVYSCETDYAISTSANKILDQEFAHSDYCDGEEECSNLENVDLAFLDSSGDRVAECAALQLSPKGLVVLHDSKRPEYRPIWTMRPWASIWEIDTPRGLTVFQS